MVNDNEIEQLLRKILECYSLSPEMAKKLLDNIIKELNNCEKK